MDAELQRRASDAVAHFWRTRAQQGERQGAARGAKDQGARAAVTGGRQLDGFVQFFRHVLCEAGLCKEDVHVIRRRTILPGYFRATKEWDIVAVVKGRLLASIEFKSQVGPSFGNNFNNRTEEAIGSAHDFWIAYREGAFKDSPRPWLGYMMLLEDCKGSRKPVGVEEPHFNVFPEFQGASYGKRYELLCRRLVRERLYDAACLLISTQSEGIAGHYEVPAGDLSLDGFVASIAGHANAQARFGEMGRP
jgi:hypothetical protein